MKVKKKAISISIPIGVHEMIEKLAKLTYSTKTKVIVDAIIREYRIHMINIGKEEIDGD